MMRLLNSTLIIFTFLITTISAQNQNYFIIDNSQAIRDSLNRIKYVNPNTAVEFSFEILEKYTENRPNRVIGAVYAVLAQIYHLKGLPTQTIDYLNNAEQEFENLFGFVPPWFQIDIGNIYFSQGLLPKARSAYLNAFKTFESPIKPFSRQDQLAGLSVSLNNVALVDIELENYASAEEYYFEGLKFRRERGQHDDLAHSYLSLAELYMKWEDKDLALQYCDSTELVVSKFFIDPNNIQIGATPSSYNRYFGMSQQYRGEYAARYNRKKKAIEYFRTAENHYKNLPIELSRLMLVRAKAYSQFGDLQNAIRDIDSGLHFEGHQIGSKLWLEPA
jgi:tetratricopeptide (TPR) repeat protein